METILNSAIWRFLAWMPSFLLKRFFSTEWLIDKVYIDIRPRHNSVEIIQPDNPRVSVYLDIKNNTHFNIVIDRILLEFTYGSKMANIQHFKREKLKPGEGRSLYLTGDIDYSSSLNLAYQHQHNRNHCSLSILSECNSKINDFCIEKTLDGIKPNISNVHLLELKKDS